MITSLRQPCGSARGTLRLHTSSKRYIRPYYVHVVPRTGLVHRTDLATVYSSPRCVSTATAMQEAPIEQPTTSLPSHWVEHLAQLGPGERRALNGYIPLVFKVSALEPTMQQLSNDHLAAYTQQFRARLASGEALQSLLPEAFAVVREAASRVLGMRHYDVQILGGIVLAQGQVAEMATGEGKTLVAALPAYLYALSGKGVHIVTVNDYLAQRDASWIGKILIFLGLSVGVVTSEASDVQRKEGFAADVTYGTAYELAFTFLQDNLAPSTDAVSLRRPLHYAIVDEVDSILIDEARNPFIMTAPDDSGSAPLTERYWKFSIQVAKLLQGPTSDQLSEDWTETGGVPSEPLPFDFLPDYRSRIATLTQRGMVHAVRALAMPKIDQIILAQLDEYKYSYSTKGLYVVLMAPTLDGKLEITIRAAAGAASSSDKEDVSSLDGRRVVVESREDVESALLSQFKLVPLSAGPFKDERNSNMFGMDAITDEQWRAAAPAALWTGGDHAWGKYINQAIRAQHLYYKDIHYIVKDGEVVIIDTSTGRERHRSRWQSGLHQAVEAKEESEGVKIKSEHYDKGRTTYQSLFNLYTKLCGMTGTAVTEAEEFSEAYNVSVVRVPPHRPSKRLDNPPNVYLGTEGWEKRIIEIVRSAAAERRPVLLGTSSVEESEAVLNLVVDIPFQSELTDMDVKRLEKALAVLPDSLPPPNYPLDADDPNEEDQDEEHGRVSKLSLEQQYALQSYLDLMELYEDALFATKRLRRSRRLTPEIGVDIERGGKLFRALASSNNNDLLLPREVIECMEVSDVLLQVVSRSRLGNVVPINLLNARPDRARKEAQIIAQAGLPGTITVATAMAGRGTDILLGGNPKGLTLIALQYYLLPILAKHADDLTDTLPEVPPLQGLDLGVAFVSEADMKLHLPVALYRAFVQAKEAAQEAAKRLSSSSNSSGGDGGGGAGAGAAALLPGYGPFINSTGTHSFPTTSTTPTLKAQDVSDLLSKLLESVEVDRSVFLLKLRHENQTPSLEAAFEWTTEQKTIESGNAIPTERALRRYALLQWLWFDSQCEEYATLVRAAGGLATVITSIQDTRRTERQLRGRAGRQGDPGETFMISHRNDPAVQSILSPAQMQGLWAMVEAQSSPLELIDSNLMRVALKTLTRTAEQQGLSARELTRKYDAAIDSYRRHVFRLRRTLAGGGDGARGVLAHRQLRRLAAELVVVYADGGRKHPKYWQVEELLGSVQKLFLQNVDDAAENGTDVTDQEENEIHSGGGDIEAMEIVTSIQQGSNNIGTHLESEQENAWMPVRRRAAFLNARSHQIEGRNRKNEQQQLDPGCENSFPYKGRHAPAVARLQLYMGDLVTLLYERKRRALATSVYQRCNAKSHSGGGGGGLTTTTTTTPLHVLSMLRLWERNAMLQCIDSLWTDFLQDITTLQRAAMTRAFSQLDPVDEFKLEAAALFARLLRDFRRQSAVALLAPVDIRDLQWGAYSAEEQQEHIARGRSGEFNTSTDGVLDDVAWLADIMEEERKNDVREEEEPAISNSYDATPDANAGFENNGGGGELAAIEKLLARLSQVSSEELGAAIEKLDEKWKKNT
ncbi:hypothetical protein Ndes2437B_g08077 [Nannochloris sp. 'desiccata']